MGQYSSLSQSREKRLRNYISPGSQIPQVEARKRCSRDLFTSSGRATALSGRHFWYTILQQSMTRLTNTVILLTYTSLFHWRFSGNWQNIFANVTSGALGRRAISHWVVTGDSMPNPHCAAVGCTTDSQRSELNKSVWPQSRRPCWNRTILKLLWWGNTKSTLRLLY